MHWDTTKNCWPWHKSLLPHLSDRHPHSSFLAHAIQDNYQLLILISWFKCPLWGCPWLFLSVFLSSCHLAHFRRKCFASSTSCPLYSLHFLLSLPSPFHLLVSIRSCTVPPLSDHPPYFLALQFVHSLSTIILSTSSFGFSLISCSQDALTSLHAQLFNIFFSWKLLSSSTSSSLTSPLPISRMLCLRSFIHFISLRLQASTATCIYSL